MMIVETRTIAGHPFTVRHWGNSNAPKILMLHGFPQYGGAWADVASRLADRYHCIAPDQRGYGASYTPHEIDAFSMQHLVADMATLIGSDPVIVMGHDWGASVAYGLAMFRPDLVSRLVVMNGVHPVPFQRAVLAGGAQTAASQYIETLRAPGSEDRLTESDFAGLLRVFSAHMDMTWFTGDVAARHHAIWRRSGLRGMINWYRASPLIVGKPGERQAMPDLPLDRLRVNCPHLLIWGMKDTALLPEATEGLEDFAPGLTRVDVPDADHWIAHQTPDQVAQAVRDWL